MLIHDHHEGYLTWAEFEENQVLLRENAHMQKRAERKAARGGRPDAYARAEATRF